MNENKTTISRISTIPDMIAVRTLEYWDGSKYMARLDKPSGKVLIDGIREAMRKKFAALKSMEQRKLALEWAAGKGQMLIAKTVRMSVDKYNRVEKIKE